MNLVEMGWLAGIIEGEGCIYLRKNMVEIKVAMTDEDTVRRLQSTTGMGVVYPRPARTPNRKDTWEWSVHDQLQVAHLLVPLAQLLGKRRREKVSAAADLMLKRYSHRECNNCGGYFHSHRMNADYCKRRFCQLDRAAQRTRKHHLKKKLESCDS